mmetsp:Transcript_44442/g.53762  ORF Transcript_44442/g.53762 Transcript_44442/m.53762 type:complete len:1042 (-) Transcript_44442:49-3174(-)|eukprot:CAMPEP_0172510034 /NCGR_PEP_ID=MMETSP1066-20121228/225607_1 /TAXON_ID=671091 /ORGANISM="Coscinodiscus wailesii, Strain CCMP2513" /LENGTH=1041 /DNA_ID=CAMNT_0013288827 /DNA_START=170 /DNA_END=3295 /DNA_ORIENTATION=-
MTGNEIASNGKRLPCAAMEHVPQNPTKKPRLANPYLKQKKLQPSQRSLSVYGTRETHATLPSGGINEIGTHEKPQKKTLMNPYANQRYRNDQYVKSGYGTNNHNNVSNRFSPVIKAPIPSFNGGSGVKKVNPSSTFTIGSSPNVEFSGTNDNHHSFTSEKKTSYAFSSASDKGKSAYVSDEGKSCGSGQKDGGDMYGGIDWDAYFATETSSMGAANSSKFNSKEMLPSTTHSVANGRMPNFQAAPIPKFQAVPIPNFQAAFNPNSQAAPVPNFQAASALDTKVHNLKRNTENLHGVYSLKSINPSPNPSASKDNIVILEKKKIINNSPHAPVTMVNLVSPNCTSLEHNEKGMRTKLTSSEIVKDLFSPSEVPIQKSEQKVPNADSQEPKCDGVNANERNNAAVTENVTHCPLEVGTSETSIGKMLPPEAGQKGECDGKNSKPKTRPGSIQTTLDGRLSLSMMNKLANNGKKCGGAGAQTQEPGETRFAQAPASAASQESKGMMAALPPHLMYDPKRTVPVEDKHRQELIKNANIAQPLLNGWKLLSHQKQGILRALKMRRLVLAFDMGLGKTVIACVWAKAFKETFPKLKVFLVCPVSLREDWERTALEATGLECVDAQVDHMDDPKDSDTYRMSISSWAKVPKEVPKFIPNYVVILDEAHSMQSMSSARTKDALSLTKNARCIGCLLLTGTPMKNGKPLNLFPLLRAVRHPFGDNQKAYEIHFCAARDKMVGRNKTIWCNNGSSNLTLLNSHISAHVFYLTKEDALKDLPPRTREYRKVAVNSSYKVQYENAMNRLAKVYENVTDTLNDSNSEAVLGAFAMVRQTAAFAKIDATVALAKSILKDEPAIVIFTSFVDVAKILHQKLSEEGWNGEVLTGKTPPKKRQALVDNFQAGISPVFVGTFGAGGVGLTLTAAATIILLDRPWTPGDAFQAEDRVRRIGQTKPVKSIWMRAFEVDDQIDLMLDQKKQNAMTAVDGREERAARKDGDTHDTNAKSAPKISIYHLIQTMVPKDRDNKRRPTKINTFFKPKYDGGGGFIKK